MISLPADVQMLVLDYNLSQRDYKALCATSKACRALVLPQLYSRIKLITWDDNHARLKQFTRCVGAGAGAHLRHTRTLIFEITKPPSEPPCQLTGQLDFGEDPVSDSNIPFRETVDSSISMILEMFPDNCLHSFGYVSEHSCSYRILDYLAQRQCLQQLQITWGSPWDVHVGTYPPLLFQDMRVLDLYIASPHDLSHVDFTAVNCGSKLKRLAIGASKTAVRAVESYFRDKIAEKSFGFTDLKELSLYGLSFTNSLLRSSWQQIVSLPTVERLSIFDCIAIEVFALELVRNLSDCELGFQHLSIECGNEGHDEGGAETLAGVLSRCKPLATLHLRTDLLPEKFWDYLVAHGPSLRTLAIDETDDHADNGLKLDAEALSKICQTCPKVLYFGFQLDRYAFMEPDWNTEYGYGEFLSCLGAMQGLRLVHLRLPLVGSYDTESWTEGADSSNVTWNCQKFCNGVFSYLEEHRLCPSLVTVVVGHHFEPANVRNDRAGRNPWYYTRHCYIRGCQYDALNRKAAIAVPVPAYRVRELLPDCDLLDFDPACNWVGGLPGRIQL